MKLSIYYALLLLSIPCLNVHAQQDEWNSTITLPSRKMEVLEVLKAIEQQSGFRFSFNSEMVPDNRYITIDQEEITVKYLLEKFCHENKLTYHQQDNLIILKKTGKSSGTVSVYGYIRDNDSGENLIMATVFDKISQTGTTTNQYGYYSFTVPIDKALELRYSYVGYHSLQIQFSVHSDTLINVGLTSQVLNEVVVTGSAASDTEPVQEKPQMGSIGVPIQQIKSMPTLLGETDVLKALQLLPGVQSGIEGSSGVYVRGGSPDQNLILLDGVPVYNASHLFGFFSVFNADAINHVELIKGGFPARYGGRLSSVIDITMKEGNQKEFHAEGAVGLIASRLTLEGPIKKNKSSFIISARRTYADLIARPFTQGELGYYFYDVNAKLNYKFSNRDRIYLSFYSGKDLFYSQSTSTSLLNNMEYTDTNDASFKWGNITSAFRWNHVFNPKFFLNTTLTLSNYQFNINNKNTYHKFDSISTLNDPQEQFTQKHYASGIKDTAIKIEMEYLPTTNHTIRWGGNLTHHTFSPGVFSFKSTDQVNTVFGSTGLNTIETQVYVEDDWSIGNRIRTNIGFHYSSFLVRGKYYHSFQPRATARYLINERLSIKTSYATNKQFIHLLTNSGIDIPTDLWVPATDNTKPQSSWQTALGTTYEIKKGYEFSFEGYYKEMTGIIEYKEGANFLEPIKDWEAKVAAGRGWSYGAEVLLQKKEGRLSGWVGYTLAWANRQIEDVNFGKKFPFKYDTRNNLSITSTYKVNNRFEVGGTFVYRSGINVTLPVTTYGSQSIRYFSNSSFRVVDYYGGRNANQLPDYHRLDVSCTWRKKKKWGERAWILSVYNMYNRRNIFFISNDDEIEFNQEKNEYVITRVFKQITIFPIIPSVSYQFKF